MSCHVKTPSSHRDGWLHERMITAQSLLSRAAFNRCVPTRLVHCETLSSHEILGLPRPRTPSTRPVIALLSILSCGCLIMWPKYRSFLILVWANSAFLTPANLYACSFVIIFVHDIRSSFRMHLFSNAWMRFSSSFFSVQASHPYVATGHANAFINRNLVLLLMDLFFQSFASLVITVIPIDNLDFTSLVQFASLVTLLPR